MTSASENSLSVKWSRPQSDVPILYYKIRFRRRGGSRSWQKSVNATTKSVTLQTKLIPSVSYDVQVRAVSAIGKGPFSSEETVKCLFQHTQVHTHMHTHMQIPCCSVQMFSIRMCYVFLF